jgi:2-C-methyl-D-erythritol 4-phosphate cytidylyltransferase
MGSGTDKAFLSLGSKPVVVWALLAFEGCTAIDRIVLVVRKDQMVAAKTVVQMFGLAKVTEIVAGGPKRQESVRRGLEAVDPDTRIVVVHDGARPCVSSELIVETINAAKKHGTGIAATRIVDTVKYVERGSLVGHTVDRSKLWAVQTPQAFKLDILTRAYKKLEEDGATVTDEATAVELLGEPVRLVEWQKPNMKITVVEDLAIAAALLRING